VVIGGGFIGLEMAENLKHRGLDVRLVEMLPQAMPALDPELAAPLHRHLVSEGIRLHLNTAVININQSADGTLDLGLSDGQILAADMVLVAAGVRPNTELAVAAGLDIGTTGGIRVDSTMRTSDPHIWAVGDAIENHHTVSCQPCRLPLAGPANRQGRLAAESILGTAGKDRYFRGVQGTSVCGVLGMTVAATGINEKELLRLKKSAPLTTWEKIYIHPEHHAGYYPGARSLTLKVIYSPEDGRVLGAQAVGTEGVDKRIDVIAATIQHGGSVFDLEAAELCYAPQYGSAKDPVNVAGMVAANAIHGLAPVVHWPEAAASGAVILDVRTKKEFRRGSVPGAVHISLHDIRERCNALPTDRDIWCHCQVGQRSYVAVRILRQLGYRAFNLSGGYLMYLAFKDVAAEQGMGPEELSSDAACRDLRLRVADRGLGSGQ
jgi:rhodanese-related sulfurtransferase